MIRTWGLVCATLLCTAGSGAEFAGGTGEPNDPYQIDTAAQLLAIGSAPDLARKHYVLVSSINLANTTLTGPVTAYFSGSFDGNGHTIRNLRIDGGHSQALFGLIGPDGTVKNLGIVDVFIWAGSNAGALAAINYGSIDNCYSTGQVTGLSHAAGGLVGTNLGTVADSYSAATVTGSVEAGGLVGDNVGTLSSCHSTGEVTGYSSVGGLVGSNNGEITSSYCTATITGSLHEVGGFAGTNNGRIVSCYADVTVTGYESFVGGLAGNNFGYVLSCYASATVTGYGSFAGGLVGNNFGCVSSCYSTGSVTGEEMVGGLVGGGNGTIATSYSAATVDSWGWSVGGLAGSGSTPDNCYFLDPADGGGPDNGIGTPLTSVQMTQQASFEGWDFWGSDTDGTADLWFMPENAYPVLAWQTEITGLYPVPDVTGLPIEEAWAALTAAGFTPGNVRYDFDRAVPAGCVIHANPHGMAAIGTTVDLLVSAEAIYDWTTNAGDGTSANPYRIETAGQLESLIDHPELWGKCFVLAADLDMVDRTYSQALIAPDTDDGIAGFQGTAFTGTFDGDGHIIRNLTIRRINVRHDYVGLFGMIGPKGHVEDLTLSNADVEGGSGSKSYVGVLAGFNAGTVVDCSASGVVHGGAGDGLVGSNTGTLIDCTADISRI